MSSFITKIVPGSDLLRVAQADLAERRGNIQEADQIWQTFLAERHSTTGHIMYLRYDGAGEEELYDLTVCLLACVLCVKLHGFKRNKNTEVNSLAAVGSSSRVRFRV